MQQHRRAEKGPKYSQQCEGKHCPQRDIEIISSPKNGVTHSSVHPIAFDHPPAYCNYRSLVAIILVYLPLLRDGFSLRKKNLSPKHFHRAPWPPSQRTMTAKSTSYPPRLSACRHPRHDRCPRQNHVSMVLTIIVTVVTTLPTPRASLHWRRSPLFHNFPTLAVLVLQLLVCPAFAFAEKAEYDAETEDVAGASEATDWGTMARCQRRHWKQQGGRSR